MHSPLTLLTSVVHVMIMAPGFALFGPVAVIAVITMGAVTGVPGMLMMRT